MFIVFLAALPSYTVHKKHLDSKATEPVLHNVRFDAKYDVQ